MVAPNAATEENEVASVRIFVQSVFEVSGFEGTII